MRFIDLTGQKFGRLTAIAREDKNGRSAWRSRCECGKVVVVSGHALRRGLTKSCGCLRNERTSAANTTHGQSGGGNSARGKTYSIWASMKTRCLNPNCKDYPLYGGRGVTVCDAWLLFENFLADMGERPEGMTLDRIDPVGNYEPENCRWATLSDQSANRKPWKHSEAGIMKIVQNLKH